MTGRVILITGGNSGIGYEACKYFCEGGNDVVLAVKDMKKGEMAVRNLRSLHPRSIVQCMEVNLSDTTSIRNFVAEFCKKKRKLSVLINNAAIAMGYKKHRLKQGEFLEPTMATNHYGPFLLTHLLLDLLIQTGNIIGDSRIVNVSCQHHHGATDFADMEFEDHTTLELGPDGTFNARQTYNNSKLCNLLMSYHLSDRLNGTHVTCNAIDPGTVLTTRLMRHDNKLSRIFNLCCMHSVLRPCVQRVTTVEKAGLQLATIATSDHYSGKNGKYFVDGVSERSSIQSYDKDLQKKVWMLSSNVVNINTFTDEDFDDISLHSMKN